MQFSTENVRDLARLLSETGLHEIALQTVSENGSPTRIVVKKNANIAPRSAVSAAVSTMTETTRENVTETAETTESASENATETARVLLAIEANAVGLFRALSPALQIGDEVKKGQIVGAVESLKIPNDVKSAGDGRVVEIAVEDGQGVEYGQTLLTIEVEN